MISVHQWAETFKNLTLPPFSEDGSWGGSLCYILQLYDGREGAGDDGLGAKGQDLVWNGNKTQVKPQRD